jgi:hypothetical protein
MLCSTIVMCTVARVGPYVCVCVVVSIYFSVKPSNKQIGGFLKKSIKSSNSQLSKLRDLRQRTT